MFNKTITLFNKRFDKETRTDKYKKTVLNGVHVEINHSSNLKDKQMAASDGIFVSIPFSDGYAKPKEYQSLENVENRWTLQESDLIYYGIYEDEIENTKDLKALDDVFSIKSIDTIDFSVTGLNHFEVYGS